MAVFELDLEAAATTVVDSSHAEDGDVLLITRLGSHTLIVDEADVTVGMIRMPTDGAEPVFVAGPTGCIGLDLLLFANAGLGPVTFELDGKGQIILDGSSVGGMPLEPGLGFTVRYTGAHQGIFSYIPPQTGTDTTPVQFTVDKMLAGDRFAVAGQRIWSLETVGMFGGPQTAYHDGALHLVAGQAARLQIPMSDAEAAIFFANQPFYLNGGVFTYPGAVLCYGDGALMLTENGYRAVETLQVGDRLRCADGRLRRLIWKAATVHDGQSLSTRPELRPIRIAAGALATGYPFADLIVSPQQSLYVNGPAVREDTGEEGGLIAARHLLGLPGIELMQDWQDGIRYHHLLLEEHEILVVNGVMAESQLLGPWSMRSLDPRTRKELERVLPNFSRSMSGGGTSRHLTFKGQVARRIIKRYGPASEMFFDPVSARSMIAA